MHVLDHDGNLVDASCLALVAALMHYRRPDFEVRGEDVEIFDPREREPIKLSMQHQPFCITFGYYEDGSVMLLDSTVLEEQCREGEVIISMNRFGEVCQIAKYSGEPVDGMSVMSLMNTALEKVKVLDQFVKAKLDEDEKKRDAGGVMAELRADNAR